MEISQETIQNDTRLRNLNKKMFDILLANTEGLTVSSLKSHFPGSASLKTVESIAKHSSDLIIDESSNDPIITAIYLIVEYTFSKGNNPRVELGILGNRKQGHNSGKFKVSHVPFDDIGFYFYVNQSGHSAWNCTINKIIDNRAGVKTFMPKVFNSNNNLPVRITIS